MHGALTRLTKRQVSMSFESWQFVTEQTGRIREQLHRAFYKKTALAFDAWVQVPPAVL